MKTIEEFIKEIEGSEALKNELKAIKDKEALADFLKKNDVSGTAEDFYKAVQAKAEEGEISDDEAEAAAGGWFETYDQNPTAWERKDAYYADGWDRVIPPKWPCPKCGSREVSNYDPGCLWQMRVYCKKCGFYGCRDGSYDDFFGII